jgi:dTDP-4-amino-4,6-dideoxygalactose transaminase
VTDRRNESGDLVAGRLPIAAPTLPALDTVLGRLRDIWSSGVLTNGRTVAEFEATIAERLPDRHVIAVNSCTAGLMLALRAMDVRGEVLLPSFTFTATAHAVVWNGCTPVWVDCDPDTFNIDIDDLQRKITSSTRAIVAVYVSGNPPRIAELEEIARQHGLKLILDAAHALGSKVRGTPAGCFGDAEVFSLSPTKTITTCEGGLLSVRDPEVARRLRIGRNYANPGNYDSEFIGLNARMSEIHALVGLASLPALDANIAERQRLVAAYEGSLRRVPGIRLQHVAAGDESACKDFSVRIVAGAFGADRDTVRHALTEAGIETRTYFDPPVHRQTAYRAWRLGSGGLPHTDTVAAEVLNLPLFVGLSDRDIERVVQCLLDVRRGATERVGKKPAHAAV